jgi:Heterokaryon incompatibility protein (HET)
MPRTDHKSFEDALEEAFRGEWKEFKGKTTETQATAANKGKSVASTASPDTVHNNFEDELEEAFREEWEEFRRTPTENQHSAGDKEKSIASTNVPNAVHKSAEDELVKAFEGVLQAWGEHKDELGETQSTATDKRNPLASSELPNTVQKSFEQLNEAFRGIWEETFQEVEEELRNEFGVTHSTATTAGNAIPSAESPENLNFNLSDSLNSLNLNKNLDDATTRAWDTDPMRIDFDQSIWGETIEKIYGLEPGTGIEELKRAQQSPEFSMGFYQAAHAVRSNPGLIKSILPQATEMMLGGDHGGVTPGSNHAPNMNATGLSSMVGKLMEEANLGTSDARSKNEFVFRLSDPFLDAASSSHKQYTYNSIDISRIRLLHVGGETSEQPQLSIQEFEVSKAPKYYALSYAWGSEEDPIEIPVNNGQRFAVTQNLYMALSSLNLWLRHRKHPYVWIDAICIDQKNNDEKAEQIRRMCDIYRSAEAVIAFLGTPMSPLNDLQTKQIVSYLCTAFIELRDLDSKIPTEQRMKDSNHLSDELDYIEKLLSDDPAHPVSTFLVQLFDSPWWQRAWIVQEVFSAKETLVVFGSIGISFQIITKLASAFQFFLPILFERENPLPALKERFSKCSRSNTIVLAGNAYQYGIYGMKSVFRQNEQGHVPLLQSIDMIREQSCKISRDKIYAALGLAAFEDSETIIPDYSNDKSDKDVRLDVVNALFQSKVQEERLDVIGCVSHPSPTKELEISATQSLSKDDMPTWLPDWTQSQIGLRSQLGYNRPKKPKIPKMYQKASYLPSIKDERQLLVKGWKVEVIETLADSDIISSSDWKEYDLHIKNWGPLEEWGVPSLARTVMLEKMLGDLWKQSTFHSTISKYDWQVVESVTSKKAVVPRWSQSSDWICSFLGGSVYYVIRPTSDTEEPSAFTFVGEAYLFGEMDSLYRDEDPNSFVII